MIKTIYIYKVNKYLAANVDKILFKQFCNTLLGDLT